MSLTLVQLAEAIQNDRAIQVKGSPLDGWTDSDLSPISLHEIKGWLKFGNIRIKPEPREYWLEKVKDIDANSGLWESGVYDYIVHDSEPSSRLLLKTVVHVKEVI